MGMNYILLVLMFLVSLWFIAKYTDYMRDISDEEAWRVEGWMAAFTVLSMVIIALLLARCA